MTYWIRWHGADGREETRHGPFDHRRDAVRRIAEDMARFAADLEYGTGTAGEWTWDTAQVATLYRGDLEIPLGRYVIEQVAPEARTDDDARTPPSGLQDRPQRTQATDAAPVPRGPLSCPEPDTNRRRSAGRRLPASQ